MKLRHKFLLAFIGCQLVLVVCGAASLRLPGTNLFSKFVRGYSAASGADSGYGFFAPGVGAQFRFSFTMTDAQGRTWTDDLHIGTSQEANLRLTGMANYLSQSDADHRYRVMQSLAAKMFARHPKATKVTVSYQMWGVMKQSFQNGGMPMPNFPRMNEVRDGARPDWMTFQVHSFVKGKGGVVGAEQNAPFRFAFTMTGENGRQWTATMSLDEASAISTREHGEVDLNSQQDRDKVMQTLALVMFNRQAKAKKITVQFQERMAPAGDKANSSTSKPAWKTVEEQTFQPK